MGNGNSRMRTRRKCVRCFFTFLAAVAPAGVWGAEATIAVATNFAAAAASLEPEFERLTGHTVTLTVGSTGKLYAQVRHGAPFDVFLAADQAHPELLERENLAVAGSRFTYAVGGLALWSADPTLLTEGAAAVLRGPKVRHLAIANPDLAPYGRAARQVLERLGLWREIEPRIVMGQDVGATYAMVATGNAEAGFVALSSLLSAQDQPPGSRWDVPAELYDPIRQDAVQLVRGAGNPAAAAFLQFLRSPTARGTIARSGYAVD
jgi:molybdate transport system substrate-binding protein